MTIPMEVTVLDRESGREFDVQQFCLELWSRPHFCLKMTGIGYFLNRRQSMPSCFTL